MRFLHPTTAFLASSSLASSLAPLTPPPSTPTSIPIPSSSPFHQNTPQVFSARVTYGDFEDRMAHDSPIFRRRFRLSDRLSMPENLANIRIVAGKSLKVIRDELKDFVTSFDPVSVVNVALRAAVRVLTPGCSLLDPPSMERITDDLVGVMFAQDRLRDGLKLTLPLPQSLNTATVDSLAVPSTFILRIPTLLDVKYGLKYFIVHLDFSAVATLGVRFALAHLDPGGLFDTYGTMQILDNLLDTLGRLHRKPFHNVGEIMLSLNSTFPFLGLSSLLDVPLRSVPALLPARKPVGYARPPTPSVTDQSSPISPVYPPVPGPVGYTRPLTQSHTVRLSPIYSNAPGLEKVDRQPNPVNPRPTAIGNYVIEQYSSKSNCRNILCVVIAISAGAGLAILSRTTALAAPYLSDVPDAEQAKQDLIEFHALQGVCRLSAERRRALWITLSNTVPSETAILKSDYKFPIADDLDDEETEARIMELFFWLSSERRQEFLSLLAWDYRNAIPSPGLFQE